MSKLFKLQKKNNYVSSSTNPEFQMRVSPYYLKVYG